VFISLKVFGELPTLSIGLTDDCVTEILQVLVSIPLPEGYSATTDEDVDDFAESVSTWCIHGNVGILGSSEYGYIY